MAACEVVTAFAFDLMFEYFFKGREGRGIDDVDRINSKKKRERRVFRNPTRKRKMNCAVESHEHKCKNETRHLKTHMNQRPQNIITTHSSIFSLNEKSSTFQQLYIDILT